MSTTILVGSLEADAILRTARGPVLLTTMPITAAQAPEHAPLPVIEEERGKTALVEGVLDNNVLYEAHILEVTPRLTGVLLTSLSSKGLLDPEEITNALRLETEQQGQSPSRLCALVVGHKKNSPGAVNLVSNMNEFDFNDELARQIENIPGEVRIQRIYRRTYDTLPSDINDLNPDFVVSLHCNAYNRKVSGTEVLFYHKSIRGKKMAAILQQHLVGCLSLTDRGIKEKTAEDRGGYLLRYTLAPCLIAEPFFIDNDQDLATAREAPLARTYRLAIEEMARAV